MQACIYRSAQSRLHCTLSGLVVSLALIATASVHSEEALILPLGDSITEGYGGFCSYREPLLNDLRRTAACAVRYVGPRTGDFHDTPRCQNPAWPHAGFSGLRADEISPEQVAGWVSHYKPRFVLLHLGTNDIFQGQSVESTVSEIDALIAAMLTGAAAPWTTTVLLANVIPWDPTQADYRDNPHIDELRRFEAFSTALETLATERQSRGEPVELVDVRSGFDPLRMTIEGVHPNAAGQQHLADRFRLALYRTGLCGENPSALSPAALPRLTLKSNAWEQFSLPGDPGELRRVADVFDELPGESYGSIWSVYGVEENRTGSVDYRRLALESPLKTGVGYWIVQMLGTDVSIAMPTDSRPASLVKSAACASQNGCIELAMRGAPNGTAVLDLIGSPFATSTTLARARVRSHTGVCRRGCALEDASSNELLHSVLYHYEAHTDDYRNIDSNSELQPWEGAWAVIKPGAAAQSSTLLLARD